MVEDESRDTPPANEIPETESRTSVTEALEERDENEAMSMHSREPSSYDVIVGVIATYRTILYSLYQ